MNILAEGQEELSTRFAKSGGDKFAGVGYRLGAFGTPILEGTLGHVECQIVATHEGGDHVIHVGEVHHAEMGDGRPLLFFQGRFTIDYGLMSAGVLIISLPVTILFLVFQRDFVKGLASGALKG